MLILGYDYPKQGCAGSRANYTVKGYIIKTTCLLGVHCTADLGNVHIWSNGVFGHLLNQRGRRWFICSGDVNDVLCRLDIYQPRRPGGKETIAQFVTSGKVRNHAARIKK